MNIPLLLWSIWISITPTSSQGQLNDTQLQSNSFVRHPSGFIDTDVIETLGYFTEFIDDIYGRGKIRCAKRYIYDQTGFGRVTIGIWCMICWPTGDDPKPKTKDIYLEP